ncbi:MAG: PPC domain-containing DNA-binding protein [Terriglobales bacterium]
MGIHAAELTIGRTFGVAFGHGDDFFAELSEFCADKGIRYGYIPLFLGAFRQATIVGTCQEHDADIPMFSHVDVEAVETLGGGTLAYDGELRKVLPHVHLSVGKRLDGSVAYTSHLIEAQVQFTTEMVIVEVISPEWSRLAVPALFDLNLLRFGSAEPP